MRVLKERFRDIYGRWLKLAHLIGRVNTAILLTVFYAIFIGVAKVVSVVLRKDLLDRQWKDRESYWKQREGWLKDRTSFLNPY